LPIVSGAPAPVVAATNANAGLVQQIATGLQLNASAAIVSSGANAPTIGGNVGDLYVRTNPASDATYLYRCTVAGGSGVATWAAITGA
jgi:hypothetical protein